MSDSTVQRCSLCSLVCDSEAWMAACDLRSQTIDQYGGRNWADGDVRRSQDSRRFAEALRAAELPLFTGHIGDVQSAQAAVQLARRSGGILDRWESEREFESIASGQIHGLITSTLAEVRFRSDVILLLGDDQLIERFPNLLRWFEISSNAAAVSSRKVVLLGDFSAGSAARLRSDSVDVVRVAVDLNHLPASLASHWFERMSIPSASSEATGVADYLDADYLSVLWDPACIETSAYDLWLGRMAKWLMARNEVKRTVAVPLASTESAMSQVCTWQTGFAGRVRFQKPYVAGRLVDVADSPNQDLHQYSARTVSDNSVADLIVWIDTRFPTEALPDGLTGGRRTPDVILSVERPSNVPDSSLFLPISAPGLETPAHVFRCDGPVLAFCPAIFSASHKRLSPKDWSQRVIADMDDLDTSEATPC
jgi:formylmethanofuran dehydrogenase subunit B